MAGALRGWLASHLAAALPAAAVAPGPASPGGGPGPHLLSAYRAVLAAARRLVSVRAGAAGLELLADPAQVCVARRRSSSVLPQVPLLQLLPAPGDLAALGAAHAQLTLPRLLARAAAYVAPLAVRCRLPVTSPVRFC